MQRGPEDGGGQEMFCAGVEAIGGLGCCLVTGALGNPADRMGNQILVGAGFGIFCLLGVVPGRG